ncbi:Ditrans,polycis-undecaprenyl-diphosphate synthase ((2E,6E)-farnesyl-diphosphate specific) [subsurface metagenome]
MNLQHVAIVPDGNRRWAKQHALPPLEGHKRGAEVMHNVIDYLIAQGIKYLTVWGFSMDNWRRSNNEVESLFRLLEQWIYIDTDWLEERNVKLRHIGRIGELPDFLQLAINQAGKLTQNNTGMILTLAFNYGGRAEIVDAVNQLLDESVPQHIDEKVFSHYLYTDSMPDVDLVIRTAGEFRLSNFLLWQTAYSEFFFSDKLWPDFDTKELEKALQVYSERQRRFGGD